MNPVVVDQEPVRKLVRAILRQSPAFVGRAQLLAQVDGLRASGSMTWLDLAVAPTAVPSPFDGNPVPGNVWAYDDHGQHIGVLVIGSKGGYLSVLELGWVTDETPTLLPDPHLVAATQ